MKLGRILIPLILLIFLSLFSTIVRSQDFDDKKAFSDYLFALDIYRKEYAQYQKARDFYLQNKTLGLKENARLQTYNLLVSRDELLSVYETAIRMRLLFTPQHAGAERGDILHDLEEDAPWYSNHKSVYNKDSDAIEILFQKGKETTAHFDDRSSMMIYRDLSTVAFSKYLDIKSLHEHIYWPLKAEAETKSGTERERLNRWITDIDSGFQKVTDVELAVKKIREDYLTTKTKPEELHRQLLEKLNEGKEPLLAINGYLDEMRVALNK